jgi:hypothetical protein
MAFDIVVVVAFKSNFYWEIYQNNIFFYFLKIIFDVSLKISKNINLK